MASASGAGARWARMASIAAVLALAGLFPEPVRAQAEKLEEAIRARMKHNEEALASQTRIEDLSDRTEELFSRHRSTLRQIEALRDYNQQLDELVAAQDVEMEALRDELDRIELVSRDVTPLMLRMIEALDRFVSLDLPFLERERRERIEELQAMMRRADVSDSEKFRRVMEAYQIENEYGRTIEAYRAPLDRDGGEVTVDFLRVGRIALVYQTLDEREVGVWNREERRWEVLDESWRETIRRGLRIARKQAPPDLLEVPLPPAEPPEGSA